MEQKLSNYYREKEEDYGVCSICGNQCFIDDEGYTFSGAEDDDNPYICKRCVDEALLNLIRDYHTNKDGW